MTGLTGEPNSTLSGRFGDGSLAFYTDEDREEYERQSGMPGKGGNYKSDLTRTYVRKGGGKAMIGLPVGVVAEEALREIIASVLAETLGDKDGKKAFAYELMRSQEGDDEEEDDEDVDEQSVAANVAGYTLPLGMSNRSPGSPPPWDAYARAIGGTPLKVTGTRNLKVRRMNKSDKY